MSKTANILARIIEQKDREVALLPERFVTREDIREILNARRDRRDFFAALKNPKAGDMALIAEVKKASPSAGVICKDFDPVRIAVEYEASGADCLSVLTDEKFFQGSLEYLKEIRAYVRLPLLRKDFIIDERQILEAAQWGADAILLIVAILSQEHLERFHQLAVDSGLAALVEVHDENELDRALQAGARLIGVNNRDLKSFTVNLGTTERIATRLAERRASSVESREQPTSSPSTLDPRRSTLLVAESGIHTREDVERLAACGARAILVGESLMRGADIRSKIAELTGR